MLYQPSADIVNPGVALVEGADSDTDTTVGAGVSPVPITLFWIQVPFNHAGIIGYGGSLRSGFIVGDSLRRAFYGTLAAYGAELGNTKVNRMVRHEWQVSNHLAQSLSWAE